MVFSVTPMGFMDLLQYNNVNIDRMTETYGNDFYSNYFTLPYYSEYSQVARHGPTGVTAGYMLGKSEGEAEDWHAHIWAATIAPPFRRGGLGRRLMEGLEEVASAHSAYFIDLFVRKSNTAAQEMYRYLDYVVYPTVAGYYSDAPPVASTSSSTSSNSSNSNLTGCMSTSLRVAKALDNH